MRKPKQHIRSWESYPKSVSLKIQTIQAIEELMDKTGKSFSQIVEHCCYQLVLTDKQYFRSMARDAAMNVVKWEHMAKVAETRKALE